VCIGGVNLPQFKLSIHQTIELGKLYEKHTKQWRNIAKNADLKSLTSELSTAGSKISESISSLQKVLEELNRLSSEGESVTITKI